MSPCSTSRSSGSWRSGARRTRSRSSAGGTRLVATASNATTARRWHGTDERRSRDTPKGKPASAPCTAAVAGAGVMTRKRSDGSGGPPSRYTPSGRPTSGSCTAMVAAFRVTTRKRSDGSARRPSRAGCRPGQPRVDVRVRPRSEPGPFGSSPVVSLGGRPKGTPTHRSGSTVFADPDHHGTAMPPPPRSGLTGAAGGAARNDHNRWSSSRRARRSRGAPASGCG